MERRDVIVVGAGAAGLYCAGQLGLRGLRVTVLDHARRIGEKIRISGGGRCNFTNLNGADPARYLSGDPRFVRSRPIRPSASLPVCVRRASGFTKSIWGSSSVTIPVSGSLTCCWPTVRVAACRYATR